MYCPSCGTALTAGLSYCNRCGASLSFGKGFEAGKLPEKLVEPLVWAIWSVVVVTIVLAGIMLGSMPVMKEIGLPQGFIVAFVGLIFLTMVAVDGLLFWHLFRLGSRAKERDVSHVAKLDTSDFDAKREQPLLEPRVSVTENTTRNFEPIYEERRNRG